MDISVQSIKAFVCLAPERHTAYKTIGVSCVKHGQALIRRHKPPKRHNLCGLLNVHLMAVDFANYRESDRFFAFMRYLSD